MDRLLELDFTKYKFTFINGVLLAEIDIIAEQKEGQVSLMGYKGGKAIMSIVFGEDHEVKITEDKNSLSIERGYK